MGQVQWPPAPAHEVKHVAPPQVAQLPPVLVGAQLACTVPSCSAGLAPVGKLSTDRRSICRRILFMGFSSLSEIQATGQVQPGPPGMHDVKQLTPAQVSPPQLPHCAVFTVNSAASTVPFAASACAVVGKDSTPSWSSFSDSFFMAASHAEGGIVADRAGAERAAGVARGE